MHFFGLHYIILVDILTQNASFLWWGNLKEREHWLDPGVDGRIVLRWIFRKWDVRVCTKSSCFRLGHVAGTCECSNELSGSIKWGEFLGDVAETRLVSQEGLSSLE